MSEANPYMSRAQLEHITTLVQPEPAIKFKWGQAVKFSGGRYNGFNGVMRWCGTTCGSVSVGIDGVFSDIVEDLKFIEAQPEQT